MLFIFKIFCVHYKYTNVQYKLAVQATWTKKKTIIIQPYTIKIIFQKYFIYLVDKHNIFDP